MTYEEIDTISEMLYEQLEKALLAVTRTDRDFTMIAYRFGIFDRKWRTLQETGDIFNLSRERVSQIEKKVIRRMKTSGNQQLRLKNNDHPCTILLNFFRAWVKPGDPSDECNIATLAIRLSDIPVYRITHLITQFCYPKDEAEEKRKSSLRLIKAIRSNFKDLQRHDEQQQRIFNRLFANVAWPTHTKIINDDEWLRIHPKRQVSHDCEGDSGSFYSKKNKFEIEYESQLEYRFCMYLEQLDAVAKYVQQPLRIPYTATDKDHIYYPDFFVRLQDGRCVVVEIKSHNHMGFYRNIMKWIALQEFCMKYGFGYLVIENTLSLNDYIYAEIDKLKIENFLQYVSDKPISWSEYRKIRETLSLDWKEATSIILQNDLKLTITPFRLSKSPKSFTSFIERHKQMTKYIKVNKTVVEADDSEKKNASTHKTKTVPEITKHKQDNSFRSDDPQLANSYNRWDSFEDNQLIQEFNMGMKVEQIAEIHKRKIGGIQSRLKKLGLIKE